MEAKTALSNMRGEVWATVHTLAENDGITFDACLGLALTSDQPAPLQIPIDILFQTQMPLPIAYCPESSIYRRWHPEQGDVSPLHKEIGASRTLSKVLGEVIHQPSEGTDCPPSLDPSDHPVGSGR